MTSTEARPAAAERAALPSQPLATCTLNSTLLGALGGRGNAVARLAAEAMVAVGLELESRGHVLDAAWCSTTYLALHPPMDRAMRTAPPKHSRTRPRKGAGS